MGNIPGCFPSALRAALMDLVDGVDGVDSVDFVDKVDRESAL